jgi:SNF2 family DNA or RNA helicase
MERMISTGILDGLMHWQREEVALALATEAHRALWGDPGTGKTPVIVRTMRGKRLAGSTLPHLYLCPSSLVRQVAREILTFWPGARVQRISNGRQHVDRSADVVVVGYGLLSRPSMLVTDLKTMTFDVIACDESHMLRNPVAARTQIVLLRSDAIIAAGRQRIFASGTMLVNHAGDMWPMISRLGVSALAEGGKAISRGAFENRFVQFQTQWFGGRKVSVPVGSKNLDSLKQCLAPHMRRITLREAVPEMPPLRVKALPIAAEGRMPDLPEEIEREVRGLLARITKAGDEDARFALMDLLEEHQVAMASWRRHLGMAKVQECSDILLDRLEGGEPCALVFVHHRDVGDAIATTLANNGIPAGMIRGDTSPARKDEYVQAFQAGALRCLVLQHESGGVGLNLQAAAYGLVVESPWTAAAMQQSIARMHRKGQQRGVLVHVAAAEGTLDEIIAETIARKASEAAEFE